LSEILTKRLVTPHPERLAYVQYALRQGHTVKQVAKMTSMDPWFLYQLKEINDQQLELENIRWSRFPRKCCANRSAWILRRASGRGLEAGWAGESEALAQETRRDAGLQAR